MAAITGLAGVWALSPSVAVKVEGSAVLLQPDSRVGFYARSAGQIQSLSSRVGDGVQRGQLLVSLSRLDQAAAGAGAIGPNPDSLVKQQQAITSQIGAINSQIGALRTTNKPVQKQLEGLESLRRDEVIPRYSPLWVGALDLYLRNQSQIKVLEGQLAQLEANRAALEGEEDGQSVLAPQSGRLLSLTVGPGQAVLAGQRLGTLGPGPLQSPRPRLATALFSDADVVRLRLGGMVQLDPQLQTRDRYGGTAERYGSVQGKILTISPAIADLAEITRVVGDQALAESLMARSRQAAFGEGGDPMATLGGKITNPLKLVIVELAAAQTPSGLLWSGGKGPDLTLENGTPAKAKVEVERRSPLSFVLPFLRWLGGAER